MAQIRHGQMASLSSEDGTVEVALKFKLNLPPEVLPKSDARAFDFLFPELQTQSDALLPESPDTVEALKRLGLAMVEQQVSEDSESATPAAYTYLGQFLAHEITFEKISDTLTKLDDPALMPLSLGAIREQFSNERSPKLDLDSVYGSSLRGIPVPRIGARLALGKVSEADGRPVGKDDWHDLPRTARSANSERDRQALIGDERNDENLITAQLHVAFLRAHNELIARGFSFEEARVLLRQHFQWLVIHDFLKRVADPEIVQDTLARGYNRFYMPPVERLYMPLEFSAAVFRFGHSMVRPSYHYNDTFPSATLEELFRLTAFSGNLNPQTDDGSDTLPESWIIEWEHFLDGGINQAQPIDTFLTEPLFALRNFAGSEQANEHRLAVRNLLRGYQLRLPTGQAVAAAMGLPALNTREMKAVVGSAQAAILQEAGLMQRTPLWYYILAESAAQLSDTLGPVGSTILAEVLIELVRRSEDSILLLENWQPSLGANPGRFTLRDLLSLAGVLNRPAEPINPLDDDVVSALRNGSAPSFAGIAS